MVRMLGTLRTLSAFLLLIICSMFARAYPIAKIVFHGNARITSGQLLDAISPATKAFSNATSRIDSEVLLLVEQAKQSIQKTYSSNGYLYARIDSFHIGLAVPNDSTQGFQLDFYIFEGSDIISVPSRFVAVQHSYRT